MIETKVCRLCGTRFEKGPTVSRKVWEHSKYCSMACRKNPPYTCLVCSKVFFRRGTAPVKTCSYACARKRQTNYKGGISRESNPSKFSRGQRQRIRRRDKVCQDCNQSAPDMVIHHMTFTKDILPDNLLVLLCRGCHSSRHYEHDKLQLSEVN